MDIPLHLDGGHQTTPILELPLPHGDAAKTHAFSDPERSGHLLLHDYEADSDDEANAYHDADGR